MEMSRKDEVEVEEEEEEDKVESGGFVSWI